jgi:hypothetical protein
VHRRPAPQPACCCRLRACGRQRQVDSRSPVVPFALVLLYVAIRMFRPASGKNGAVDTNSAVFVRDDVTGCFTWPRPCALTMAVTGGAAGLLSGLLGVVGGFVMVPALQRYTDLPLKSAVATSLAVIALISLGGRHCRQRSHGLGARPALLGRRARGDARWAITRCPPCRPAAVICLGRPNTLHHKL